MTPPRGLRSTGPANVVRVALTDLRWPIDPALAEGRDETTLARTLYSTPLRVDPATGAIAPGLCTGWTASPDFRRWTFSCRSAAPIAAALRRVGRLPRAPLHWAFAGAAIRAEDEAVHVRLSFPWRRFPYVLTAVGSAPRTVPGPFRLVSGSANKVVVRNPALTVLFRRLGARAALREFRRGMLDEAPVPPGDIAATKANDSLGESVRVRTLLGLDVVVFHGLSAELRRVYWETANRADYEELVPEREGSGAYGLVGGEKRDPARFRRALSAIPSLPRIRVRMGVPQDAALRAGANLLYAQWRDLGLGPQLVHQHARPRDASFSRLLAAYPQEEAIPAELVLRGSIGLREPLLRALAATRQRDALDQLDALLRTSATVVPVAWVEDARLVSARLVGWREDALGDVDYSGVRSRASSRSP